MGLTHSIITEEIYEAEFFENLYNELSPGAHLATVFWTSRPHRLIMTIEDAGFEIRDVIIWITKNGNLQIPLARKPLEGTVAENVLKYGCGGLNIDGCRIPLYNEKIEASRLEYINEHDGYDRPWKKDKVIVKERKLEAYEKANSLGRYPANIIHDGSEEILGIFPKTHSAGSAGYNKKRQTYEANTMQITNGNMFRIGDNGGSAARFFQTCKNLEEVQAYIERMIKC